MKRTPGLILFCLLTHAATDNELLRCPKSRVRAAVGKSVTLEFHVDLQPNVTIELFKLMFNQSKRVLVYRGEGDDYFHNQHKQFKDRVSLESNSENLSKGEFVVKISPLKTADAGTYTCTVRTEIHKMSCSIDLIIEPKENSIKGNQIDGVSKNNSDQDPGPTPKRGDHNNTCIIVSVIGIVVVVGIVVAVVLWRRRTSQRQENNQNVTPATELNAPLNAPAESNG